MPFLDISSTFILPFIKTLHLPDPQLYTDKETLSRLAEGDEKAFGVFFKQYSKLVYSFLYRHTDDAQWVNDLVQDIFTKLWLTRETLPTIENMGSYLFILTKNHVINAVKQRIQERRRAIEWQKSMDSTASDTDKEIYLDIIDQAVEQLPEQQRKTWIMSRRKGMKYAEIASELGISRETVKTYLQHANSGISKYVLSKADLAALLLLLKIL